MADLLSGLENLGLDFLSGTDIFKSEEKKEVTRPEVKEKVAKALTEEELIYDKQMRCPVCEGVFTTKVMKTGRAKMIGTDFDLRPMYENIDAVKYDVCMCTKCGYAALTRYFGELIPAQKKIIKDKISKSIQMPQYKDVIYSYDQALERYKIALANAVVKNAKSSEKAYICLKIAWLLRGYREDLEKEGDLSTEAKRASLSGQEEEYLRNAYAGLRDALQKESFPICGMDELTLDYLLAQLAFRFGELRESARFVQSILVSKSASGRVKEKALVLKDQILKAMK